VTENAGSKRRNRERARRGDQPYTRIQGRRTDPWRVAGHNGMVTGLSRTDLERLLTEVEPRFRAGDPHRRQAAYATASRLYDELVHHTDDPIWKRAARLAAQRYAIAAARIKWQYRIPSPQPRTDAALLGLGSCGHCGRPWSSASTERCKHCPQLMQGPTPDTAEDVRRLGPGVPADMDDVLAILLRDRFEGDAYAIEEAFQAGHHDPDLDPAVEHLAEEIAEHHVSDLAQPFDSSVEAVVRRHDVDPDGWDVDDLTAAIVRARELVGEHGIITGWTASDGTSALRGMGGDDESRAHDARLAARLLGAPDEG
jgi:hypothetical protein